MRRSVFLVPLIALVAAQFATASSGSSTGVHDPRGPSLVARPGTAGLRLVQAVPETIFVGYTPGHFNATNNYWSIGSGQGSGFHRPPTEGGMWGWESPIHGDSLQGWWPLREQYTITGGLTLQDTDRPWWALDIGNNANYSLDQGLKRTPGVVGVWHVDAGSAAPFPLGVTWAPLNGTRSAWMGLRRHGDNQYVDPITGNPYNEDVLQLNGANATALGGNDKGFPGYGSQMDQLLYRDVVMAPGSTFSLSFVYRTTMSSSADSTATTRTGWFVFDPTTVGPVAATGANLGVPNFFRNTGVGSPADSFSVLIGAPTSVANCAYADGSIHPIYDPDRRWLSEVIAIDKPLARIMSVGGTHSTTSITLSPSLSTTNAILNSQPGPTRYIRVVFRVKTNRGSDDEHAGYSSGGAGAAIIDHVTYQIGGGSPVVFGEFENISDINNSPAFLPVTVWKSTGKPPQVYAHTHLLQGGDVGGGNFYAPLSWQDVHGPPNSPNRICNELGAVISTGNHDANEAAGSVFSGTTDRELGTAIVSPTIQLCGPYDQPGGRNVIGLSLADVQVTDDFYADFDVYDAIGDSLNSANAYRIGVQCYPGNDKNGLPAWGQVRYLPGLIFHGTPECYREQIPLYHNGLVRTSNLNGIPDSIRIVLSKVQECFRFGVSTGCSSSNGLYWDNVSLDLVNGPPALPGDVNCDGVVSGADVLALQSWLWDCGPAVCSFGNADANGNCRTDIGDFSRLERYVYFGGPLPSAACSQTVTADSGLTDTVAVGSIVTGTGQIPVPIYLFNDEVVRFVDIPLKLVNPAIAHIDSFSTIGTSIDGMRVFSRPHYCGDSTTIDISIVPQNGVIPPSPVRRNIGYVYVTVNQTVTSTQVLDRITLAPGHDIFVGNKDDLCMAPAEFQEERISCQGQLRTPFVGPFDINNEGGGFVQYAAQTLSWTILPLAFPFCGWSHYFPQKVNGVQLAEPAMCLYVGGNWQELAKLVSHLVGLDVSDALSSVEITSIGSYTINCKKGVKNVEILGAIDGELQGSQALAALGVQFDVDAKPLGVGTTIPHEIDGEASTHLKVELKASPFRDLTFTLRNDEPPGEGLKIKNGVNKISTKGGSANLLTLQADVKNLQCGVSYPILVQFHIQATKAGAAWARVCLSRFNFKIYSMDDPPEELAVVSDMHTESVKINGVKVDPSAISSVSSQGDGIDLGSTPPVGIASLTLPAGFSGAFLALPPESTYNFTPAALALGDSVSGHHTVYVSVKKPITHVLSDSMTAPIGFSGIYRLNGGAYTPVGTDRTLLRLSGVAYDPVQKLILAAERDTVIDPWGATVAETTSTLVRINAAGHADTLVWSPPTISRLHRDPVRKDLLMAAPDIGKVLRMDSTGTFTTFADSLSIPSGISRGQVPPFAGWTAITDQVFDDTTFSHPPVGFSSRITLLDPNGARQRIPVTHNRLVTDCAFAPGGVFGNRLYLSVADSVPLPLPSIPATGKIMVMDSTGNLTDFALGLDNPDALLFDPDGRLYVAVPGGVVRITQTSAGAVEPPTLPRVLAVRGPFPNPSRDDARVECDLPEAGRISIEVFDVAGRRIGSLARNEFHAAGSYTVLLPTRGLRPGVYLCRIEARTPSGVRSTRRAIVVL